MCKSSLQRKFTVPPESAVKGTNGCHSELDVELGELYEVFDAWIWLAIAAIVAKIHVKVLFLFECNVKTRKRNQSSLTSKTEHDTTISNVQHANQERAKESESSQFHPESYKRDKKIIWSHSGSCARVFSNRLLFKELYFWKILSRAAHLMQRGHVDNL